MAVVVLICAWVCLVGCSEASHSQVKTEVPQTVTVPQPTKCEVVKKNKKGEPEMTVCSTVNVTVPAQTTCVLPNDPCSDTDIPLFSWKRFKCNASAISALSALIIGFMTIVINRNVRRGQIAHDQVQTLLEIDNQLIERPELWAVHGAAYLPKTPPPIPNLNTLVTNLASATPDQKAKAAEGIAAALGIPTVVAEMEKQRRRAFAARYFNFFDILYASYGPTRLNPLRGTFNKDWQAWEKYMKDFFENNVETGEFWEEFARKGLYSESFISFIREIRE